MSTGRCTALFLQKSADLSQEEQAEVLPIRQVRSEIEDAYQLVQPFLQMMRQHGDQHLEAGLHAAQASHSPEFEAFAAGLRQDQVAVSEGLTRTWNTGQTEGQITRLKRSMYDIVGECLASGQ